MSAKANEIALYARFTNTGYRLTMRAYSTLAFILSLAFPAGATELDLTLSNSAGLPLSDAVVMVWPDAGARGAARLSGPFVLAQKNTQFQPRVLIVPVGADVSFPNLDPFHHHVFSFSKTKTFELKLYSRAETRRVTFDKAGVVGIGCNIHDAMTAYIRVVDTPFAAKSATNGAATVRDLPGGPALVTVWHPFLKAPGGEITRRVTLPASGTFKLAITGELRPQRLRSGGY